MEDNETTKQAISDMYGVISQILKNFYTLKALFTKYYLYYLQNKKTTNIQREITSIIVSIYFDIKDYDALKKENHIGNFFEFIEKHLLNITKKCKDGTIDIEKKDKMLCLNYQGMIYSMSRITEAIKILGLTNIEIEKPDPRSAMRNF